MTTKIIFYKQDKLDQNTKFKLRRDLLGLEQKSNFAKYTYKQKGLLNTIPHYRPINSAIIIEKENELKIKAILNKYNAQHETFDIKNPKNKLKK